MVKQHEIDKILKHLDRSAIEAEKTALMTERLTWVLSMMTIMLFLFASHEFFRDFGADPQMAFIEAIATTIIFTGLMIWIIKRDPGIENKMF